MQARSSPAASAVVADYDAAAHPPTTQHERARRKAQVLTRGSASNVSSISDAVVIKESEPFFLCPPNGQIGIDGRHGFGLYHHDTRFLSGYELRVAGVGLDALAATALTGSQAVLELTNPPLNLDGGRVFEKERLGVRWTRRLELDPACLVDRITFRSYAEQSARIPLRLSFAADFRDVFAVRGLLDERPGELLDPRWDRDRLIFEYRGADGVDRSLSVQTDQPLASHDATSFELSVDLAGHDEWIIEIRLTIGETVRPGATPMEQRASDRGKATPESNAPARGRPPSRAEPKAQWQTSVETEFAVPRCCPASFLHRPGHAAG